MWPNSLFLSFSDRRGPCVLRTHHRRPAAQTIRRKISFSGFPLAFPPKNPQFLTGSIWQKRLKVQDCQILIVCFVFSLQFFLGVIEEEDSEPGPYVAWWTCFTQLQMFSFHHQIYLRSLVSKFQKPSFQFNFNKPIQYQSSSFRKEKKRKKKTRSGVLRIRAEKVEEHGRRRI